MKKSNKWIFKIIVYFPAPINYLTSICSHSCVDDVKVFHKHSCLLSHDVTAFRRNDTTYTHVVEADVIKHRFLLAQRQQ